FPNTDYIIRREHLQTHRTEVVSFMKGILEGMRAIKANRALGIHAIQKYLKMNSAEEAGIAYDYYVGQKWDRFPRFHRVQRCLPASNRRSIKGRRYTGKSEAHRSVHFGGNHQERFRDSALQIKNIAGKITARTIDFSSDVLNT
ncbi:MAG TPA: hypothetical protein VFY96_13255, partial [Candidatus Binatia bacterium]|nr:hypothetical protein [Candidatus Binatia bacterium]